VFFSPVPASSMESRPAFRNPAAQEYWCRTTSPRYVRVHRQTGRRSRPPKSEKHVCSSNSGGRDDPGQGARLLLVRIPPPTPERHVCLSNSGCAEDGSVGGTLAPALLPFTAMVVDKLPASTQRW
jgi:hypothetical protein